jgi:predicted transcriptional regulator
LQLVQALIKLGQGSAREVQSAVGHLNLAHTTIATVLSRLETRGVLASELRGRERVYHCVVAANSLQRSMVSSLVSSLFDGDSKALMAHLVKEGEFEPEELDELRQMLDKRADQDKSGGNAATKKRG